MKQDGSDDDLSPRHRTIAKPRRVLYVAHCLRPTEEEIAATGHVACEYAVEVATKYNAGQALAWRNWLRATFQDVTFVAPWIGDVAMGDDDSEPAQRERGMRDNCALIAKLDGVVLCGPRISAGMAAERGAFLDVELRAPGWSAAALLDERISCIYNLTSLGATPPANGAMIAHGPETYSFTTWAAAVERVAKARPLTLDDVWCHGCIVENLGAGICRKHGEAP